MSEQIRKLAALAADDCAMYPFPKREDIIEAAILKGVKLALAEPSEEMRLVGTITLADQVNRKTQSATEIFNAMAAERLRELGGEE